jgi:putative membrane protein
VSLRSFLTPAAKERMGKAVEIVEAVSAAEVVACVRPRSDPWAMANSMVGAAFSAVTLLFMLYSPWVFELYWIALGVPLAYFSGYLLSRSAAPLRNFVTRHGDLEARVSEAAKSQFYDLGISGTRDRSGILVYVSVEEGLCRVLCDLGVQQSMTESEWKALAGAVEGATAAADPVEAMAKAIECLAEPLSTALPRREDDVNELEDVA